MRIIKFQELRLHQCCWIFLPNTKPNYFLVISTSRISLMIPQMISFSYKSTSSFSIPITSFHSQMIKLNSSMILITPTEKGPCISTRSSLYHIPYSIVFKFHFHPCSFSFLQPSLFPARVLFLCYFFTSPTSKPLLLLTF